MATDHTSAPSEREAFKDEHTRLEAAGGPQSGGNYNKVNSLGKKMTKQDKK